MSWDNQTATFLYNAISLLPDDVQHTAIRSQMMLKCRGLLRATQEQLPRCTTCGVNLKVMIPHAQIQPAHGNNRFLKRQLRKDEYYRTKYQALYIAKYSKGMQRNQKMITKCQLCKKQYVSEVAKPKGILTSKIDKILSATKSVSNKKRKRAKNKEFAGLKQSAVFEAKQHLNNTPKRAKLDSPDVINLVTPNLNNSVILLDTPRTNSKQNKNNNDSIENFNGNVTPVNFHRNKKLQNKPKQQKVMKYRNTNVILAMTNKTDKTSNNKNALANLLKQQSSPKPKSMLQNFLQGLN